MHLIRGILLVVAAWCALYFWTGSGPGQRALRRSLTAWPGGERLAWRRLLVAPDFGSVAAVGACLVDTEGRRALAARRVVAGIDWMAALRTGALRFEPVRAEGFEVALTWDAGGGFNLTEAFRRPSAEPTAGASPRPASVAFDRVDLRDGRVTLSWPDWRMTFEDVGSVGGVSWSREDGLVIDAGATGGRARADWPDLARSVAYRAVQIEGFRWRRAGFSVERTALADDTGRISAAAGTMDFATSVWLEARGDLALAPAQGATLLPGWLPDGGHAEGIALRLDRGAWELAVERATAPRVLLGPTRLTGCRGAFALLLDTTGLWPRGRLDGERMRASRVDGPPWLAAEGLELGALRLDLGLHIALSVSESRALEITLPGGPIGQVRAAGALRAGVLGGGVEVRADSDSGGALARGPIDVSLLGRRATARVDVEAWSLVGATAALAGQLAGRPAGTSLPQPLAVLATMDLAAAAGRGHEPPTLSVAVGAGAPVRLTSSGRAHGASSHARPRRRGPPE